MALDLTSLTTRAECDEVLESLVAKLDAYQRRDFNIGYAGRQNERVGVTVSAELAGVNAEISGLTTTLATPGLPARKHRINTTRLRQAHNRKDNLLDRSRARAGAAGFFYSLDTEQLDLLVTLFTSAKNAVTAHRATLPA